MRQGWWRSESMPRRCRRARPAPLTPQPDGRFRTGGPPTVRAVQAGRARMSSGAQSGSLRTCLGGDGCAGLLRVPSASPPLGFQQFRSHGSLMRATVVELHDDGLGQFSSTALATESAQLGQRTAAQCFLTQGIRTRRVCEGCGSQRHGGAFVGPVLLPETAVDGGLEKPLWCRSAERTTERRQQEVVTMRWAGFGPTPPPCGSAVSPGRPLQRSREETRWAALNAALQLSCKAPPRTNWCAAHGAPWH